MRDMREPISRWYGNGDEDSGDELGEGELDDDWVAGLLAIAASIGGAHGFHCAMPKRTNNYDIYAG